MDVQILYEQERECGFRKPSKDGVGIYLRGTGVFENCERLPFPLDVCPCCGGGFKFTRSFTWIDPMALLSPYTEPRCTGHWDDGLAAGYKQDKHDHERCWVCNPELLGSRAGLIWIGEQHYSTPQSFMREALAMGISRKIPAIPNGFEVGVHAIFLAHQKCIWVGESTAKGDTGWKAGIFMAFKPSYVDLVIDDPDNVPGKAIEIAKRLGKDKCRIVKVIPDREESKEEVGEWLDLEE